MICGCQENGRVAGVVKAIEERADKLSRRVDDAQRELDDWSARTRQRVAENPIKVVVVAFAIGVVLARLARHA
jgi:ElaB/YqjD/DUF883 family membrane-anchored ribosome-binding protein